MPDLNAQRASTGQARRLSLDQILQWAKQHHIRTGVWPGPKTPGIISGTVGEKWKNLYEALRSGFRGLPAGISLGRLLTERCGAPTNQRPPLTVKQILAWADAYHERAGKWPMATSGPIREADRETWSGVAHALREGYRGLPGGSSLAHLLGEHRGSRNRRLPPRLTKGQIVAWAEQHYRRTKHWPNKRTGEAIPDAPGESWTNLDAALRVGTRGLPGGSSLARLLAEACGCRNTAALPPLSEEQILAWADSYHKRHGRWPKEADGLIVRSGGETWSGVDQALRVGLRNLPKGSSLPRLLARRRSYCHPRKELTFFQILRWADVHHARTGRWPTCCSGPVRDAEGENWATIDARLRKGGRGLPGGSSLICLLMEARQVEHRLHPDRLSVAQVLACADEYHQRTSRWPRATWEPIATGSSASWRLIDECLRRGLRGLPGGTNLGRFLAQHDRGTERDVSASR
jgi:hypothetical protein